MAALLEGLRVKPLLGRSNKVRAFVSGRLKLAEGTFIYLNGMRLVHGPKGLFLSFPAGTRNDHNGEKEFVNTYFLSGQDRRTIERQAIVAFNKRLAA
jgi:hypothetical protein